MNNDRNVLRAKRKTAIAGMTVCMAALVVTGFNRGRSMRQIHTWAGLALIGLSVWLLLDLVYQHSAQRDLSARLHQQLHAAAVTERGRIHKSLESFRATAHYLANYRPLHQRLRGWNRTGSQTLPAISQWQPDWLPGIKSVDERIDLDVAAVLGRGRETHAVYGNGHRIVPEIFLQPDI